MLLTFSTDTTSNITKDNKGRKKERQDARGRGEDERDVTGTETTNE